jgi:hypothetical protein
LEMYQFHYTASSFNQGAMWDYNWSQGYHE